MSRQSEEVLKRMMENASDGRIPFDDAIESLMDELDVKEKTALSYVYTSENFEKTWDGNERYMIPKSEAQKEVDKSIEKARSKNAARSAGDPTNEKFKSWTVLEESDHPLVPESKGYLTREIIGSKTDLDMLTRKLSKDTPSGQKHVLLEGLPGTGKNAMVREACAKTNRPMVRIPASKDIRYEDVVGHYAPNDDPDGPAFEWKDGLLTMAWRYGWVVVFDEINMAGGDITAALHQVTEGVGDNDLVIRQTGEIIEPHPEAYIVATMNPYGHAGTKQLNEAFESRFSRMEVPYLDAEGEKMVLMNEVEGLDDYEEEVEKLIEFAGGLREQYVEDQLNISITTRELIKVCDHIADGFLTVEESIEHEIGSMLDKTDQTAFKSALERVF